MKRTLYALLIFMSLMSSDFFAQEKDSTKVDLQKIINKFDFNAYGVINYYNYNWDTYKDKRAAVDPERLNMYLYYNFTSKIQLKTEIEFEHGGTGGSISFDPLEEFGAFNQDVEKGGSVVLEQINILFKHNKSLNFRVGKFRYYAGNAAKLDEPTEYFTGYRSETENTILPLGWYETGVEISGDFKLNSTKKYPYIAYKAYIMTGLDNSGFGSLNWVRKGYQSRFETINADNLAYSLRLDYVFRNDSELGFTLYAGNTTGNRPKKDFTADAWLLFSDLHYTLEAYPWRIRAYGFYGFLQNSEALSVANRNLSNDLGVIRTPVGESAVAAYVETGYDLFHLSKRKRKDQLYVFGRTDYYDSMFMTQGTITDNPKYEKTVGTFGFNYFPHPKIVFKTHYSIRTLGTNQQENTFTLGLGFNI